MIRSRFAVLLLAASVVAAVAAGLILHGVRAAALLLLVAAALVGLSMPLWPSLTPQRRTTRFLVIAALIAGAVGKLLTNW